MNVQVELERQRPVNVGADVVRMLPLELDREEDDQRGDEHGEERADGRR